MNAANLLYQGSLFCCILDRAPRHTAGVLQVLIEYEPILYRPRNFFVILAVDISETMNIPRANWLSPSSV